MDIYIYSDESGVFDYYHNDFFVFGGLICFGSKENEQFARNHHNTEKYVKEKFTSFNKKEIKASNCKPYLKQKIFNSFDNCYKFGVVIYQKQILKTIFADKKTKQRYLDYAYKITLKRLFETLIENKVLEASKIQNIFINADEHVTATNGLYELKESILQEFKYGTYNKTWNEFFPPILPYLCTINVKFCDSKSTTLVRAADFIANHIFLDVLNNNGYITAGKNIFLLSLPNHKIIQTGLEYFKKT